MAHPGGRHLQNNGTAALQPKAGSLSVQRANLASMLRIERVALTERRIEHEASPWFSATTHLGDGQGRNHTTLAFEKISSPDMHMAPAEIDHIYISDITPPVRRPRLGNSQFQIELRLLSLVSWRALLETMQEPVASAPPQQRCN